mmetsp:Transcript_29256/g.55265  ORF Transcript_29256/g.55265 Transcript_29256/m.55265 type:complete len:203 (-) Transcript_29256:105-713(-)
MMSPRSSSASSASMSWNSSVAMFSIPKNFTLSPLKLSWSSSSSPPPTLLSSMFSGARSLLLLKRSSRFPSPIMLLVLSVIAFSKALPTEGAPAPPPCAKSPNFTFCPGFGLNVFMSLLLPFFCIFRAAFRPSFKTLASAPAATGCCLAAFTSLLQNVFLSFTGATSFSLNISTPEAQMQRMFTTVRRKLIVPHDTQSSMLQS